MLMCLNGDTKFLTRLIPISNLTSAFLFEQIELTVQAITSVPADVNAIIWIAIKLSSFKNDILHSLKNFG